MAEAISRASYFYGRRSIDGEIHFTSITINITTYSPQQEQHIFISPSNREFPHIFFCLRCPHQIHFNKFKLLKTMLKWLPLYLVLSHSHLTHRFFTLIFLHFLLNLYLILNDYQSTIISTLS